MRGKTLTWQQRAAEPAMRDSNRRASSGQERKHKWPGATVGRFPNRQIIKYRTGQTPTAREKELRGTGPGSGCRLRKTTVNKSKQWQDRVPAYRWADGSSWWDSWQRHDDKKHLSNRPSSSCCCCWKASCHRTKQLVSHPATSPSSTTSLFPPSKTSDPSSLCLPIQACSNPDQQAESHQLQPSI